MRKRTCNTWIYYRVTEEKTGETRGYRTEPILTSAHLTPSILWGGLGIDPIMIQLILTCATSAQQLIYATPIHVHIDLITLFFLDRPEYYQPKKIMTCV